MLKANGLGARAAFGGLVLGLVSWSQLAASQASQAGDASPLALVWSAPEGCPSRERVLARVAAILGSSTRTHAALSVRAVAAEASNGRWRVTLEGDRSGETGHREFEAESCEAAADATALIVGLMIDPTVVPPASEVVAPPGVEAKPTPAPPPPIPPPSPAKAEPPVEPPPREPSVPAAPSDHPPLLAVRASSGGDVGTFPRANVGAELAVAVTPRFPGRLRFELAASYWARATATVPSLPGESAQLDLAALAIRAAYVFPFRDFALAPLAGVEADRMSATGFGGTAGNQEQSAIWAAFDLGATASYSPLRPFALALTVEAVLPTERPTFEATVPPAPNIVLAQPSFAGVRAFLGVEVRFL